jgi:hypothetical protein
MQKLQSKDYFARRSDQERAAAEQARDARAAQSHRELAERYRNLANGSEQLPVDEDGGGEHGILTKEFRIVP